MEEIVAEPCVAHASLFGGGFERRVRINHAHRYEKTVIRNAVKADAAIVVRHIFNEPVDGVVGVRAFINALGVVWVMQRAKHDELSFGAITAANVLKRENVALG